MTHTMARSSIAGTATVVRFNWPKYVAVGALLAGVWVAAALGAPVVVSIALWFAAAAGCFWTITSLIATWWIYDHRHVYDHLTRDLGDIGTWASINAGFDDATPTLARHIGSAPADVIELALPPRSSLRRARHTDERVGPAAAVGALPLATGGLDTIFVTFAVHEVRDRTDQQDLFAELHRALRPGGRLVVTEHLRDLANVVVYGPGALHFQPPSVWCRRAAEAGFTIESDTTITPFVHRYTWRG